MKFYLNLPARWKQNSDWYLSKTRFTKWSWSVAHWQSARLDAQGSGSVPSTRKKIKKEHGK